MVLLDNRTYILEEYKKRNLNALLVEYMRISIFMDFSLDKYKFIDDDTICRHEILRDLICDKLLDISNFFDGHSVIFEYQS